MAARPGDYMFSRERMQRHGLHSKSLLQLTLALIKPDAVAHPLILQAVHQRILDNNFIILMRKYLKWSQEESRRFYAEHSDKFFYQRVVQFMASGPMRAYILAHEDAITHWRQLMGPTRVFRARYSAPLSIRGELGLTDTRNTTHGSGSYFWCPAGVINHMGLQTLADHQKEGEYPHPRRDKEAEETTQQDCEDSSRQTLAGLVSRTKGDGGRTVTQQPPTQSRISLAAAEAGHVCSTLALSATREPAADVNSPFLNLHSRSQAMEKDSPESAAREISFFFPDFQQQRWLSSEEKLYRQGHYYYHPEQQVHLLRDPQPLLVRGH